MRGIVLRRVLSVRKQGDNAVDSVPCEQILLVNNSLGNRLKGALRLLGLIAILLFAAGGSPSAAATLRVGVASMVTPVSAVRYYQQIVDYLSQKLRMEAEMVHRVTYDEIDRMLEKKTVDVAFICSAPYIADRDAFGVELLAAPVINGKTTYHSDIIVHKDSAIGSVGDLQGKSFAFVDPKSNSGRLYPLYLLARQGKSPEEFFGRYCFSYSHNKSVEMVAKKKVAAAAVDSVVYAYMLAENSPYARQTRIIHRSPEFGIPPVVVPAGLSPDLKERLRKLLVNMHQDPEGKKILSGMRIERFKVVPNSNYDLIRKMRDFLRRRSIEGPEKKGQVINPATRQTLYNFGIIPRDNPRIVYEKYQPLLDYLNGATGIKMELLLKKTYEETVQALGSGELDLALLGPLTYLDAYNRYGTPPIAKSKTVDGSPSYYSVIVTGPASPLTDIGELRGKSMAFASIWSTSGNLMPRYLLAWQGIHLDKLKKYNNFNYQYTVVKKVLSGVYDAGGIRQAVARKYLKFGLRVLATSDPIPTGPIVVAPDIPYAVVRALQDALFVMDKGTKGRQVLKRLDPDLQGGFVAATADDYEGIRKMINDVPSGCGISCHPKTRF